MGEDNRTAFLWLEKEQLSALGEAVESVLRGEGFEALPAGPRDPRDEPVFPLNADVDYRVGELSMGLYRDEKRIVVTSAPAGTPERGDEAGISFTMPYEEANELSQQIVRVVAAGRPPCPLCSGPLDPAGHVCPRQNGYHAQE
jgi:uncharacterized repeat protein (TIGR03847 family)